MTPMLKLGGATALVVGLGLVGGRGLWPSGAAQPDRPAAVEMVEVAGGRIHYRPFGSFSHQGKARTPLAHEVEVAGFAIMKYQVRRSEYAACVAAGACAAVPATGGDYPQTHVNWKDANAYAAWYAGVTGAVWRLPSDAEWQLAAAERFGDAVADSSEMDPGQRMLARYRSGALLRGTASPALRPPGGFGLNSNGLADISGNVWEWTDGCMHSGTLHADGSVAQSDPYCWVRIAGGLHRAAIVDFVRDASVGGCAVGLPPDHLGFRLVREAAPGRWWWDLF